MKETYILDQGDMTVLDFLMSDYEAYLKKDGREDDVKTVQRFIKKIEKGSKKGNSL